MNDRLMKQSSPDIDKLAGIEYYTTEFNGIGGTIKKNTEDFHVQEIISNIFLKQISPEQTTSNIFPVYEIRKKGMDSSHAVINKFIFFFYIFISFNQQLCIKDFLL